MKGRVLATTLCAMILCGCSLFVSWDDVTNTWVGAPVTRLQAAHGPPSAVIPLAEGQSGSRYDLNAEGIIVGQRHTGYRRPV